jgi:hypothetical protein
MSTSLDFNLYYKYPTDIPPMPPNEAPAPPAAWGMVYFPQGGLLNISQRIPSEKNRKIIRRLFYDLLTRCHHLPTIGVEQ